MKRNYEEKDPVVNNLKRATERECSVFPTWELEMCSEKYQKEVSKQFSTALTE